MVFFLPGVSTLHPGRRDRHDVLDMPGERFFGEAAVKYMIMIQMNPSARAMWDDLTDEQRADGYQLHKDMVSRLEASGELVVSEALADVSLTRRVNVKDGVVTTTDGPFAEVKEYLAGFYLVDCENIDRAIEHAARLPEAELGLVEVRPVLELP
jgi:hypothetical protein